MSSSGKPFPELSRRNATAPDIMLAVLTAIAIGFLFLVAKPFLVPFFLAILLFFVLQPLVSFFTRMGIPKYLVGSFVVLFIFLFGCLVAFLLFSSLRSFVSDLPTYLSRLQTIVADVQGYISEKLGQDARLLLNYEVLIRSLGNNALNISEGFMSFLGNFMTVLFLVLFFILEERFFAVKLHNAFEKRRARRMILAVNHISRQVGRYLATKFVIGLITAFAVLIVLLSLQVRLPLLWTVLTFLFNFIPFVGAILVSVSCMVFIAIQFLPDITPLLISGICFLCIQVTFGNIIEPRLLGRSMGLSPLIILISLLLWASLWGVSGAFMAVPLTSMIKITFENIPPLKGIAALMRRG